MNEIVFGTATPVSGQTKALGAPGDNIQQLWGFLKLGQLEGRRLWLGAAGLVIVGLAVITMRWRASRPLSRLMAMTLALVVGQAILVAYLVTSTSFMFPFSWYHFQLALFALGGTVVLGSWSVERFGSPARLACLGRGRPRRGRRRRGGRRPVQRAEAGGGLRGRRLRRCRGARRRDAGDGRPGRVLRLPRGAPPPAPRRARGRRRLPPPGRGRRGAGAHERRGRRRTTSRTRGWAGGSRSTGSRARDSSSRRTRSARRSRSPCASTTWCSARSTRTAARPSPCGATARS